MKKAMVIFFCLLLIASLAACGSKKDGEGAVTPSPGAATPGGQAGGTTADAEALYKQHCLACHGGNLEGKLGGNTNLTKVGGKLSKEEIVTKIENGGNGMTAFKNTLNSDQINALADWLSTKK